MPAIVVRKLLPADFDALLHYLQHLSTHTKNRFGPHAYDADALIGLYDAPDVRGYVAMEKNSPLIIAYAIVKDGILKHDRDRLLQYQYPIGEPYSCTYAPSVADNWQGKGIGKIMFRFIVNECRDRGRHQIILWGGVQCSNENAIRYYDSLGFVTLGQFEYNGLNKDMLLELQQQQTDSTE